MKIIVLIFVLTIGLTTTVANADIVSCPNIDKGNYYTGTNIDGWTFINRTGGGRYYISHDFTWSLPNPNGGYEYDRYSAGSITISISPGAASCTHYSRSKDIEFALIKTGHYLCASPKNPMFPYHCNTNQFKSS